MASLPAQHPRLALHLTDRALTPLISSSPSSLTSTSQQQPPPLNPKPSYPSKRPVFSTSPPGSPSDESSSPLSSPTSTSTTSVTARSEEALTNLTSTALSAYDAAKRLGKGAPLRTMVEYPDAGLVVLHSYMCPMSLTLGMPGRNASSTSLHTAAGAVHPFEEPTATTTATLATAGANGDALVEGQARQGISAAGSRTGTPTRPLSSAMDPMESDGGDEEEESPNAPPMLIGTVVAPRAEDLREARRAAGRLERIARVFQTEWVVEGGAA